MIEVRFHRSLYAGELLDEALRVYEPHARIERAEEEEHWVVRVTHDSAARERRVAGELANYALGLTVRTIPSLLGPGGSRGERSAS